MVQKQMAFISYLSPTLTKYPALSPTWYASCFPWQFKWSFVLYILHSSKEAKYFQILRLLYTSSFILSQECVRLSRISSMNSTLKDFSRDATKTARTKLHFWSDSVEPVFRGKEVSPYLTSIQWSLSKLSKIILSFEGIIVINVPDKKVFQIISWPYSSSGVQMHGTWSVYGLIAATISELKLWQLC